MSITYYLARPDNRTLFDMEGAFWLSQLMPTSEKERVDFRVLYLALNEWHADDAKHLVAPLMSRIQSFAGSRPVYFVSENSRWIEGDDYRTDTWPRIVDTLSGCESWSKWRP
jgi:hypothetical protein